MEHDLLAKINTTLEPLLGADKFRATASVECDFTSAEQSEETFDPSKSVMVNSQKTEDMSGGAVAAGIPGTASTLPRRPRRARRRRQRGHRAEPRTSAINPAIRCAMCASREGAIKRMSVSLLVDSDVRYEGTGAKAKRVVEAPSADKLKAIHDLVAGVIGLSTERGDQLVVETLPFESTLNPEQLPAGQSRAGRRRPPGRSNFSRTGSS